MNEMTTRARKKLGAQNRETEEEKSKPRKFALATNCHRAIDLSCCARDACGALALGLDSRLATPNLRCQSTCDKNAPSHGGRNPILV